METGRLVSVPVFTAAGHSLQADASGAPPTVTGIAVSAPDFDRADVAGVRVPLVTSPPGD